MKKKESLRTAGAPSGNKNGLKLKGPDVRQEAFRQYCEHLARGWPRESFVFEHPELTCCSDTIESYIANNPIEFPSILIKKAMAKRYQHWMQEGETLMKGGYKNGSPVVWQTIMRNMFKNIGWDRDQITDHQNKTDIQKLAQAIRAETQPETERSDRKC